MGFLDKRRLDDHAEAGRPDIAPHNQALRFASGKSIPHLPPIAAWIPKTLNASCHPRPRQETTFFTGAWIKNVARPEVFCDCAAHKISGALRKAGEGAVCSKN